MLLYHFTSPRHLEAIMAAGYLKTVESDISGSVRNKGPQVVWTTTDPDPRGKHGLNLGATDKERIRFTIEVPDHEAHEWRGWAESLGIEAWWKQHLFRNAGGEAVTETWRVIPRIVPHTEWVRVEDRSTGDVIDHSAAGTGEPTPDFYSEECLVTVAASLHYLLAGNEIEAISMGDVAQMLVNEPISNGTCPESDRSRLEHLVHRDMLAERVVDKLLLCDLPRTRYEGELHVLSPWTLKAAARQAALAERDGRPQNARPKKRAPKQHGRTKNRR